MNTKAVQVIVVPAHEQLGDAVQVRDRQAVRTLDPPPNGGMSVPQQELQLQQQRRALFDHRPTLDHHAEHCPRFVMGSQPPLPPDPQFCTSPIFEVREYRFHDIIAP